MVRFCEATSVSAHGAHSVAPGRDRRAGERVGTLVSVSCAAPCVPCGGVHCHVATVSPLHIQ